jgi:DNA-binding transcriptional LysR family regulator
VGYVERYGVDLPSAMHRWVAWPRAVEHKPAFQWLEAQYPERRTALRVNSANAVQQAVKRGVGIAPLAHSQTIDEPSLICLHDLPGQCSTPVWLLTHKDLQKTAKIRAALDAFGNAAGALQAPPFPIQAEATQRQTASSGGRT